MQTFNPREAKAMARGRPTWPAPPTTTTSYLKAAGLRLMSILNLCPHQQCSPAIDDPRGSDENLRIAPRTVTVTSRQGARQPAKSGFTFSRTAIEAVQRPQTQSNELAGVAHSKPELVPAAQHAPLPEAGSGVVPDDDAGGRQMAPAATAGPNRPVDLLAVARGESLVKAAHVSQCLAAKVEAVPHTDRDVVGGRWGRIRSSRKRRQAFNSCVGRLLGHRGDGAVVAQCSHAGDSWASRPLQVPQPPGKHHDVAVDDHHVMTVATCKRPISRTNKAEILVIDDQLANSRRLEDLAQPFFGHTIGSTVVDHEEGDVIGWVRLQG